MSVAQQIEQSCYAHYDPDDSEVIRKLYSQEIAGQIDARMLNDPYFTVEELSAIALGYTKLLEESAHLLNDLKSVVNENGLSMSDKDRMDIIDKCYSEMLQYRGLVQYYTNKNIGVSYLRAKKQNDVDRVMSLYGSPSERYW